MFECTKDWANVYKYANGMKANTDYVYNFRAKANMNSTMNIKINDNWASDSAHVKFDVTTEWQEFTVDVNSGDYKSAPILMFSVNVPASTGMIFYLDYVTITEKGEEPEAPVENPDNIVKNGYFTNDIAGWSASGGTVLNHEDGALHADFNESWGFINAGTYNLKANTEYVLTFKAKSINGGGVTPKMNKTDWSGTVVEKGMNFTGEWADYEWVFTTTDITSLMLFFQSGCDANAGQEVWLDDVVLLEKVGGEEPEEPVEGNLIVNGDFETGDNTGWEIWQSTVIEADAAKDGAFGAHLKGTGNNWGRDDQSVELVYGGNSSDIVDKIYTHTVASGTEQYYTIDHDLSFLAPNGTEKALVIIGTRDDNMNVLALTNIKLNGYKLASHTGAELLAVQDVYDAGASILMGTTVEIARALSDKKD